MDGTGLGSSSEGGSYGGKNGGRAMDTANNHIGLVSASTSSAATGVAAAAAAAAHTAHTTTTTTSPAAVAVAAASAAAAAAGERPNQFPWKLYDMLDTAEARNEEHVISWIRDGTAFKVHNRPVFMDEYMKKMFNQTKYKSFQRQLNLWGFERFQHGPDKGAYYHPLFVKGNRDCCSLLTRVRLKGEGTTGSAGGGAGKSAAAVAAASPSPRKSSSTPSSGSRAATLVAAATLRSSKHHQHSSVNDGFVNVRNGLANGGGAGCGVNRHVPIAPAVERTGPLVAAKISPGESTTSIAMDGTSHIQYGNGMGVPSSSSFEVMGVPYSIQAPGQQVSDLLQFHATSREERHRQIAAAAAALGNESTLLPSLGSSDSANTHHTATSHNMAVDDRLSGSGLSSLTGGGGGGSIQHQDRALQHLHQQAASSQSSTLAQPQPSTSSSSQERRPSNQMLALLAATEQERRGEDLSLLLSFDQQNNGENDASPSSKKRAPTV